MWGNSRSGVVLDTRCNSVNTLCLDSPELPTLLDDNYQSEHVIGSVVTIRDVNLHQIDTSFLVVCKRCRSIFIGTIGHALIIVVVFFRVGSTTGPTTSTSTARTTSSWGAWTRGTYSIDSSAASCTKSWNLGRSSSRCCLSERSRDLTDRP